MWEMIKWTKWNQMDEIFLSISILYMNALQKDHNVHILDKIIKMERRWLHR